MSTVMKTPGVYIVEKNAFPNSVVEVATAVPAFIGYTEKADNKGNSLLNKPWAVSSLAEFIEYYGRAPKWQYTLQNAGEGEAPIQFGDNKYWLARADAEQGKNPVGASRLLYLSVLHFFQNGGGRCYIVSVGSYKDKLDPEALTNALTALEKEQEPTMVLVPEAVLLDKGACFSLQKQVLMHCGYTMRNRVAILDIPEGYRDLKDGVVGEFREQVGKNQLNFGAAYYPWVNATLVQDKELSFENITNPDVLADAIKLKLAPDVEGLDDKSKQKLLAKAGEQNKEVDRIPKAGTAPLSETDRELLHNSLLSMSSMYRAVMLEMKRQLNVMPPGGAMAGLYTMVDNTRGVWKAPANISMNGVVSPTVNLTSADQEDLNVTPTGKSINAIRSFIGEGVLVWGARTLDGNSLDWRYVNVRRTMIMLEESCRLAAKALVFEPNVANTWVTIKGMIGNFLTSVWKRGGLAGAVPDDAFSVHVGLGETMTPEDILEGILRVTVLVAISRPAEFIEITFQQQMQKS